MSKDTLPTQSTTLEALLRGEGLDKRNNSKNDEESLLEIQVSSAEKLPKTFVCVCFFSNYFQEHVSNLTS